jgi:hypothetical protein
MRWLRGIPCDESISRVPFHSAGDEAISGPLPRLASPRARSAVPRLRGMLEASRSATRPGASFLGGPNVSLSCEVMAICQGVAR